MVELNLNSSKFIDLDGKASPVIIADLFSINISNLYKLAAEGHLPEIKTSTYRELIRAYFKYIKVLASGKDTNLIEEKLKSEINRNNSKTALTNLEIKKQSGQLVDVKQLLQEFSSFAMQIRTQLLTIPRKYPETREDIYSVLQILVHMAKALIIDSKDAETVNEFEQEVLDLGDV